MQFSYAGDGMDFSEKVLQHLLLHATKTAIMENSITVDPMVSVEALLRYYKVSNRNHGAVIVVDCNSNLAPDALKTHTVDCQRTRV